MQDGTGRNIDISRKELLEGLRSATNNPVLVNDQKHEMVSDKILKAVNTLSQKIDGISLNKDSKNASMWTKMVSAFRSKKTDTEKDIPSDIKRSQKDLAKSFNRLHNDLRNRSTPLWIGISQFDAKAQKQISESISIALGRATGNANKLINGSDSGKKSNLIAAVSNSSKNSGKTSGGSSTGSFNFDGGKGLAGALSALGSFERASKKVTNALGLDFSLIWDGVVSNNMAYLENMRQITYQVKGYTVLNRDLEKSYLNIDNAVRETGMRRDVIQKNWLKNVQRGLAAETALDRLEKNKDKRDALRLKRHLAVTKTALHTSKQLGMNADLMNDTFMDWHMHLGLTSLQLGNVGRSMREIAKDTGVTGASLESAVKQSAKYMKDMRGEGILNPNAMKNIMQISTLMEKYGVSQQGAATMNALSSSQGYMQADPKTQALLMRAAEKYGLQDKVLAGTINRDRRNTRKMGQSFEEELFETMRQSGFSDEVVKSLGFDKMTVDNIDQIVGRASDMGRDDLVRTVNQVSQQKSGMGIGDFARVTKSFDSMDDPTKLAKLQADLDKAKAEGIKAGMADGGDKAKELQKRIDNHQQKSLLSSFTNLSEAVKTTGGVLNANSAGWAEKAMASNLGDEGAKDFMNNLSGNAGKLLQNFENTAGGKDKMQKIYEKHGITDSKKFQQQIAAGNETALHTANAIANEIATKQASKQSPIAELLQKFNEWNETISSWTTDFLSKLDTWHVASLIVLGGIATTLGSILTAVASCALWGGAKRMLGFGGKGSKGLKGKGKAMDMSKLKGGKNIPNSPPKAGMISRARAWLGNTKAQKAIDGVKGFASKIPGAGKMGGALKGAGNVLGPIMAGVGAYTRAATDNQEDLDKIAERYGKSWDKMTETQKIAARTAQGWSGAMAAVTTDVITWGKDMTVGLAGFFGLEAPQWLKDFDLTEAIGLGKDGLITQGLEYVTGSFAWAGEKLGNVAGSVWSSAINWWNNIEELDKKIEAHQKKQKTKGYDVGLNNLKDGDPRKAALQKEQDISAKFQKDLTDLKTNFSTDKADELMRQVMADKGQVLDMNQDWGDLANIVRGKEGMENKNSFLKQNSLNMDAIKIRGESMGKMSFADALIEAENRRSKDQASSQKAMENLSKEATTPGSIYTHDVYLEKLFEKLINLTENNNSPIDSIINGFGDLNDAASSALDFVLSPFNKKPSASTTPIDYSDETKGEVNSGKANDIESLLEREKYGTVNTANSSAALPELSGILDYLSVVQSSKLDRIIEELVKSNNINAPLEQSSLDESGVPVLGNSGLKKVGRTISKGYWGLQAGPYSQSNVNSDGRR